ncbi:MAG: hypothetical protein SFV15_08570 [Polyangiaceae bacterium]|nr:hypothetical protein [Polyangiaceae bacterium]
MFTFGVAYFGASSIALADAGEDQRTEARALARDALAHMHEQRWPEAQALLAQAYRLMPAPTLALLEGRALEPMGRWVAARASYERASLGAQSEDEPEAFKAAREEAKAEIEKLDRKIPKITLMVQGSGAKDGRLALYIDDKPLTQAEREKPVWVDPGEHTVRVQLGSEVLVATSVGVSEGEQKSLFLGIAAQVPPRAPPPLPPPKEAGPQKTAAWVAFGVGGTGIALGAVTGFMMLNAQGNLNDACGATCPASASDELARFRTTRTVSFIGYGTGLVGVAVGAFLYLTDDKPVARADKVGLWSDGKVVGVRGAF